MITFRTTQEDNQRIERLLLKFNIGSTSALLRLALLKLEEDQLVARTFVPPPPEYRSTLKKIQDGVELWGLAMRNFYPIDLQDQPIERAVKVQEARDLSDRALTEFGPLLRLMRSVAAACTANLDFSTFAAIRNATRVLQNHIEENKRTLLSDPSGSQKSINANKAIKLWTPLVEFLVLVGFGTSINPEKRQII